MTTPMMDPGQPDTDLDDLTTLPDGEPQEQDGEIQEVETQEETVDWKAKTEELTQLVEKLTNDNKSLSGRELAKRVQAQEGILRDLVDELGGNRKTLNSLVTRIASGETDALPNDLAQITKETADQRRERSWETGYQRIEEQLLEALKDDEGNLVITADSEESAALAGPWKEAAEARDLLALSDVVTEANKMVRRMERQKAKEQTDQIREEERAARKGALDKVGAHDLSVGVPAAGVAVRSWADAQKATKVLSHEDYFKLIDG